MTTEELSKLGITDVSTKLHPRMFIIPEVGEVNIPVFFGVDDIFNLIYIKGYGDGMEKGKVLKQKEIRGVLGITDI